MKGVAQDLRYTMRQLRKNPSFAASVLVILALSIGANSAVFSVVNALLLNPYPFPEANRLVWVDARHISGRNSSSGYRDFLDWREQNRVFSDMAIVPFSHTFTWTGQGEPLRIVGGRTTENFLRVLGVQPVLGRFISTEEDKSSASVSTRVAVLSYEGWQRRFGGRIEVLGRVMLLDGEPYTIVGVLPKRFAFPGVQTCEFFTALQEDSASSRYQHQYDVVARLKPAVTMEQAQANMAVIARRLEQQYPETNKGWGVAVLPIRRMITQYAAMPTTVLFSAVLFVLLLACANLAGLMLARTSGRAREIAVRTALGAGRLRLIRQILTESVLLALVGGGFGLLFADWLMKILRAAVPEDLGIDAVLHMDSAVLLFTFAVAVLTGIVFGVAPAWYGAGTPVNRIMKESGGSFSATRSRRRILSYLVVAEVSLSLVLLVGAGLLAKDLFVLLHLDLGIRTEHVLTFRAGLPYTKYSTPERVTAFYQTLLSRLKLEPGVDDAAAVDTLPMTGQYSGGAIETEGRAKPADWMDSDTQYNASSPGYFRIMGIPLLRGRDFDEHDDANAVRVAIVNDIFAKRYFPHQDPIGHRFRIAHNPWCTVIAVTGSFKHQQPMQDAVPMAYFSYAQSPSDVVSIAVHTKGNPGEFAAAVRRIVRALDSDLPIVRLQTMRQIVMDSVSEQSLIASFLVGFAGFALALAMIGIYSIIAYSVAQRMHEMGLRIALGASRQDILRLTVREGALLSAKGLGLGIPLALALSRGIGSLLYRTSPRDLLIFTGIPCGFALIALAAGYIPARRAAKVDPIVALRSE